MHFLKTRFAIAAFAVTLVAAGCAHIPPAVGTWTGGAATGNATLTLTPDGSGNLSVPVIRLNKAVRWKEDDDKVTLSLDGGGQAKGSGEVTAVLASDKKTMALSFPMISLTLTKQEAAAAK